MKVFIAIFWTSTFEVVSFSYSDVPKALVNSLM